MKVRVIGFHRRALGELRFGRTLAEPRLIVEVDDAADVPAWGSVRIGDTVANVVEAKRAGNRQRLTLRADEWHCEVQGRPGKLAPDDSPSTAGAVDVVPVYRFRLVVPGYSSSLGRPTVLVASWLGAEVVFREPSAAMFGGDGLTCLVRHAANLGVESADLELVAEPMRAA